MAINLSTDIIWIIHSSIYI